MTSATDTVAGDRCLSAPPELTGLCYKGRLWNVCSMAAPNQARGLTLILRRWSAGDASAADELTPLVYDELRRVASIYMRAERGAHTLQPTALVNEAYLRLMRQDQPEWQSRSQFFRFSAHLMRQVLVDHARTRNASKRGAHFERVTLTDARMPDARRGVDLLALDAALDRLAEFDERRARVIELRYFGGLSEAETAESLGISVATARRDLRVAEAWLWKELTPEPK